MEMIVSVGLFIIVMTIALTAILSMINANRKAQSLKSVMNNLNLALENMSRDIKFGKDYYCGSGPLADPPLINARLDCFSGSPGNLLSYTSKSGLQVVYRLNGTKIERSISPNSGGAWVPATAPAPEITINSLKFIVQGSRVGDDLQPTVIMVISGFAGGRTTKSDFSIQTTISQRVPDS